MSATPGKFVMDDGLRRKGAAILDENLRIDAVAFFAPKDVGQGGFVSNLEGLSGIFGGENQISVDIETRLDATVITGKAVEDLPFATAGFDGKSGDRGEVFDFSERDIVRGNVVAENICEGSDLVILTRGLVVEEEGSEAAAGDRKGGSVWIPGEFIFIKNACKAALVVVFENQAIGVLEIFFDAALQDTGTLKTVARNRGGADKFPVDKGRELDGAAVAAGEETGHCEIYTSSPG